MNNLPLFLSTHPLLVHARALSQITLALVTHTITQQVQLSPLGSSAKCGSTRPIVATPPIRR